LSEGVVWLLAFVGAYWAYCVYWGAASARLVDTANDYFLADRGISPWIFMLAATATSFSGWIFLGHPAFIYQDGFQFAQLSLCAVTIPLTGVMFLKRQWLLGKRFGYVTPGDMFADYFGSEGMRRLVVLIALVFSIPFLAMQLTASGYLIQILSEGGVDRHVAMWVLTAVLFLYVCIGGLRAVAYVGTFQGLLLAAGFAAIGLVAYGKLGGLAGFNDALAKLGATAVGPFGTTAEGYNGYLEIPGVIPFTRGLGVEAPVGGPWTASMILSYSFALMGIQAAPAFTIWAFASRSARGFAAQQVWASAAVIGLILIFFSALIGMGAHFLGATPAMTDAGLAVSNWLPAQAGQDPANLVAYYIQAIGKSDPWFTGLLAVCALAAIQAMVAFYASTAGTILSRDVYKRYLNPEAGDRELKLYGRVSVGLVLLVALLTASYLPATESELGALALSFGFQLWPALAAVCWFPWLTRQGVVLGLVFGLVAVIFTEPFGESITSFLGFHLPWGRWPWTIHSAAWGMFFNLLACLIVSAMTQGGPDRAHRGKFHDYLADKAGLSPERRLLRPAAWAIALAWIFFAVGPGAVWGSDFFGKPNGGAATWVLSLPSIWAWQILWWALGVLVIWFLAYKMGMSTAPIGSVEYHASYNPPPLSRTSLASDWRNWFWGLVIGLAVLTLAHWIFG
jgi:SSS family solute:Na+ symporter